MMIFNRKERREKKLLHKAVCDLNEAEIRKLAPYSPANPVIFWAGIHKARSVMEMATDAQKRFSEEWLAERKIKPYNGQHQHKGTTQ